MKTIVVAGGCFWGVQEYYQRLDGVDSTVVGYAQGVVQNPTYEQVCTGKTAHTEAVKVLYDETVLSLETICDHFFRIIDPTSLNRQGGDIGTQYRTGIYYTNDEDKETILKFIQNEQKKYMKPIVVEVQTLVNFYDAETYHQDYLQKNVNGYCHVDFHKIKPEELKREKR